jgi:hypothetical protein
MAIIATTNIKAITPASNARDFPGLCDLCISTSYIELGNVGCP